VDQVIKGIMLHHFVNQIFWVGTGFLR